MVSGRQPERENRYNVRAIKAVEPTYLAGALRAGGAVMGAQPDTQMAGLP